MKGPSRFWAQLTDGMALGQLWNQLRTETRTGYRLYAQEATARTSASARAARPDSGRPRSLALEFAWAILLKLSPSRRVVLLAAVIMLFTTWFALGALLLLALLALEVADRVGMKRDLEIAREIQLWLLPSTPPTVAGAEVAFTNRPANTVSGDYYDAFFRTGEPSLLLALADVAGKGLPAAMLMATFQASLRTLAAEAMPLPEVTLALNRFACANSMGGTRFTTAFLAEFDPAARRLRYCNAGHNPPLLRRQDGSIEKLERGGVPLGILPEAGFECDEVSLRAGDALVIFSDGVTESFSPSGEDYGEARLVAALQAAMAVPVPPGAAGLLEALVEDCARFRRGARQQDDLTCLVLRL